ncbi:MAG TPA: hypothetical protein VG672_02840 [Bryobacteraceae bacterium]|nr:hypothetical protein [Bryobacteraceae bacterium]
MHFDLNDYSIPPEAVGRPLTLVASDTDVRILDAAAEIARHHRSYDRQQSILDPAHEQALLRTKRKALHATRAGRLALAVPESDDLLERAFAPSPLPALDLSRHPEAQALDVRPHDLETYDELAHSHDDDPEQ